MSYVLRSARWLAADCLRAVLSPGDRAIDATMGNGHDTCLLAELVGETGHVDAFDVQAEAVASTRARLEAAGLLDRCTLIHAGHQTVAEHVHEPVRAAVFNLGWLPGGDHGITTHWKTTEIAVRACLQLLQPLGVCIICVYPGHAAGDEEREKLTALLASLRPQEFNVLHQRFLNAGPGAPECLIIQKQEGAAHAADLCPQ